MSKTLIRALFAICLIAPVFCFADPPDGFIAEGSYWQTPYYVIEGSESGPTVLVIGGIHGNEPAGARAANQIRHWKIEKGKLVVVPFANVAALTAFTRNSPNKSESIRDLNRNFPKTGEANGAASVLSGSIWHFVQEQKPDWLLDLHEGADFHQINKDSVGSTIIYYRNAESDAVVDKMLADLNRTIDEPEKEFVRAGVPINASLARAARERIGCQAMILETTSKQRLALRVRQHRIMVHRVMRELEMVPQDSTPTIGLPAVRNDQTLIRVAVYDGGGTGNVQPNEWKLTPYPDIVTQPVGPQDILDGELDQFDVVAFFGGGASNQAKALGPDGRKKVREFVDGGGGYLGICAGAYLATTDYSWSLKIVDAMVFDNEKDKWARGSGTVDIRYSDDGLQRFDFAEEDQQIHFANGPMLKPSGDEAIPDFRTLAVYRSEFTRNGATPGVMIDSPAIIEGEFGNGRVFCFGCHPDHTRGKNDMIADAVRWLANE